MFVTKNGVWIFIHVVDANKKAEKIILRKEVLELYDSVKNLLSSNLIKSTAVSIYIFYQKGQFLSRSG